MAGPVLPSRDNSSLVDLPTPVNSSSWTVLHVRRRDWATCIASCAKRFGNRTSFRPGSPSLDGVLLRLGSRNRHISLLLEWGRGLARSVWYPQR